MLAIPLASSAQIYVGFNVGAPPPPLPYYSQPTLGVSGQVWQPGYWAWGPAGYYWVPGTWVTPPSPNTYWTPGYWGYNNGQYAWNNGYWGSQVGYYGGINYGYGYPGTGFYGGRWNNGVYMYNTAYANVNPMVVRRVYVNRYGIVRVGTRYAFNGPGGVIMRPTLAQLAYMHARHIEATRLQIEHARIAALDRNLYYSVNRGRPTVLAVTRPIESVRVLPHYQAVRDSDREAARRYVTNRTVTHTTVTHNAAKHTTVTHTTTTHTTTHMSNASAHANAHANAHATGAKPAPAAPSKAAPEKATPAKPSQKSDKKKPPSLTYA
jgi:hypothetical protein